MFHLLDSFYCDIVNLEVFKPTSFCTYLFHLLEITQQFSELLLIYHMSFYSNVSFCRGEVLSLYGFWILKGEISISLAKYSVRTKSFEF